MSNQEATLKDLAGQVGCMPLTPEPPPAREADETAVQLERIANLVRLRLVPLSAAPRRAAPFGGRP
jgi:hypothetical protein